jgi:hypothetical protein
MKKVKSEKELINIINDILNTPISFGNHIGFGK